jgi:hypothetical protein
MKLSDIVNYKTAIKILDKSHLHQIFYKYSKNMQSTLATQGVDFGNIKTQLLEDLDQIQTLLERIDNNLYQYDQKLLEYIKTFETKYYQQGEEIYAGTQDDTAEWIFERSKNEGLFQTDDDLQFFISRLKIYSDWRYPGLHIRPLGGETSDCLKAFDPLYFADTQEDLLDKVKNLWNEQYQRRVRYYTINEQDSNPLKNLPQQQFGFVLATEFFNYKSMQVVEKYLVSIYNLLKPGGTAFFTYNDCDTVEGLRLVEAKFNSYTPGRMIREIAQNIGYEISAEFHRGSRLTWLEIIKPGQLTSIRDGQTLGAIKHLNS